MSKAKMFLLVTNKHYSMKTYGGADIYITSALVGGEWSV
jgi:hypothetical protein